MVLAALAQRGNVKIKQKYPANMSVVEVAVEGLSVEEAEELREDPDVMHMCKAMEHPVQRPVCSKRLDRPTVLCHVHTSVTSVQGVGLLDLCIPSYCTCRRCSYWNVVLFAAF